MCEASGSGDPSVPPEEPEGVGRSVASSEASQGEAATDAVDPRARAAWRTWLSALATDAEAAMAAALAYESLDDNARDAWLDVLDQDAPGIGIPAVALYAPLLAVESNNARRERMVHALMPDCEQAPLGHVRALRGTAPDGTTVCVILSPVYLDFVEVLFCRYTPDKGFWSAQHDPLRHASEVPLETGSMVDGATVEETPLRVVIEELAHAIVAEGRAKRSPPSALGPFVHLFGPDIDSEQDSEP